MPPRSAMAVGIAVDTTVISIAPMKRASISPATTKGRPGGGAGFCAPGMEAVMLAGVYSPRSASGRPATFADMGREIVQAGDPVLRRAAAPLTHDELRS